VAPLSATTEIDGGRGRLYYRGYEIGELTARIPFEAVTSLLWFGELPGPGDAAAFSARLQEGWALPEPVLALLERTTRDGHPLDVLRTAVSLAAILDPDTRCVDAEATVRKCARVMGLVPAVVGAWHRRRSGRLPCR
jgi:citrate synthase